MSELRPMKVTDANFHRAYDEMLAKIDALPDDDAPTALPEGDMQGRNGQIPACATNLSTSQTSTN